MEITFRTEAGRSYFVTTVRDNRVERRGFPGGQITNHPQVTIRGKKGDYSPNRIRLLYNWILECEKEVLGEAPTGRFSGHRNTNRIMQPSEWEKEPWLKELYREILGPDYVQDQISKLESLRNLSDEQEMQEKQRLANWFKCALVFAKEANE